MAKRWMILALVCVGLVGNSPATAQMPDYGFVPTGAYPGHPPEPTPLMTTGGHPNPANLTAAPPVSLTFDGSPNGFTYDSVAVPVEGYFVSAGAMGLQRQGLGSSLLATSASSTRDTGLPAPAAGPAFINFDDVSPSMFPGVRASIGYQWHTDLVEVAGFYLWANTDSVDVRLPSSIDLPFAAGFQPTGFGGTRNLFLQADRVLVSLENALGGFETNYRKATGGGWEWIFGVRYLDSSERFSILTDDDGVSTISPPTNIATYTVRAHNRIVGPQVGLEGEWLLHPYFAFGGLAKGTWGANFSEIDVALIRGDGFIAPDGPNAHRSKTRFAHIYEANLFLEVIFSDRIRLRGGYQALWLVNVPEAHEQVDFNLANVKGRTDRTTGSIFFHGPLVELHIGY